jgi:hypothetical protein
MIMASLFLSLFLSFSLSLSLSLHTHMHVALLTVAYLHDDGLVGLLCQGVLQHVDDLVAI